MDPDSDAPTNALPIISLRSLRKPRPPVPGVGQIGVAAVGEPMNLVTDDKVSALDVTFPPIGGCPSTAFTPNGGAIGTADPVQLLFWGTAWQTLPLAQLANSFVAQVKSILSGPYMSGLLQYGVRRCSFGNAQIVNSNPPFLPNTFTDQTVQNMMQNLIGSAFPEPDEPGGRNLYFVMMPPNTQYQPPPGVPAANGAHGSFQSGSAIDPDNVWVAWVGNNSLSLMTSTFSHELVEMCTDPEPPTGWAINGVPAQCSEIGDVCNLLSSQLNLVTVQSYWSTFASWVPASQSWTQACLVPTAWSVRRTLAAVGKRLGGKGLLSLQDPIPSMNQFIVSM